MKPVLYVLCLLPLAIAASCGDDVAKPDPEIPPTLKVECEDKTDELNLGNSSIHLNAHPAASGGGAIEGLDAVGEWIEIPADFEQSGLYEMKFRHATVYEVGATITVSSPERKRNDAEWNVALNPGTCGT
jgi:hypothetical protein